MRGRRDGAFSSLHPVDLLGQVLRALVEQTGIDPSQIDDVIGGCVTQIGEQSSNVTRNAVLAAGFPVEVPATTVDRQCGSSQQAVSFAAQGVIAGGYDLAVACGVESMTRVPMFSNVSGQDPYGAGVRDRFEGGLVPQGISAELVAARWGIAREDMDAFALQSHQRAAAARDDGRLGRSIVPIRVDDQTVDQDDGIRDGSSLDALAALNPAFVDPAQRERFPEISWSVTAGNASQISDGAAAVLVASREKAEELGLTARARFHTSSVVGADPVEMLTAVIPATRKVLDKSGLALEDIDAYEVNEAFACVPLAWQAETGADPAKLNQLGGAIALGHPLGASGARLTATLLDTLEADGGRFGLQTMCEAGGLANATIIERLA